MDLSLMALLHVVYLRWYLDEDRTVALHASGPISNDNDQGRILVNTTDTRDFHGNRKSRCIICMSTKKEGRKKGSRFVKAQMADVYEFYFDYTSPIWTNERRVKNLEGKKKSSASVLRQLIQHEFNVEYHQSEHRDEGRRAQPSIWANERRAKKLESRNQSKRSTSVPGQLMKQEFRRDMDASHIICLSTKKEGRKEKRE
ncbi:hypothetical protein EDB19DRAFT_1834542 [Suillus lakei]|nr:hypothetical protein EDB19DRAFT_1834542 [Suillus lakei]